MTETSKKTGKREEGGLDYQSGGGGPRSDVKHPADEKPIEDKKPQERERGASNRDDEDDGHS